MNADVKKAANVGASHEDIMSQWNLTASIEEVSGFDVQTPVSKSNRGLRVKENGLDDDDKTKIIASQDSYRPIITANLDNLVKSLKQRV